MNARPSLWVGVAIAAAGVAVYLRLGALDARLGAIERRLAETSATPQQVPLPAMQWNDSTSAALDRIARNVERLEQRQASMAMGAPAGSAGSAAPGRVAQKPQSQADLPTAEQGDALIQATDKANAMLRAGKFTFDQLSELRRLSSQAGPAQQDETFELYRKVSDAINRGQLKVEPRAAPQAGGQ